MIDLKEYLLDKGIQFYENVQSLILTCPICGKTDKLYIRKSNGQFKCFSCGDEFKSGRPDRALAALTNTDIEEVQLELYGSAPRAVDHLNIVVQDPYNWNDAEFLDDRPTVEFPEDFVSIGHPYAIDGAHYLAGRGIPLDVAKIYNIHYSLTHKRVIFPVEEKGRLLGWQGRIVYEDQEYIDKRTGETKKIPKMLGSKNTPLHKCLMFGDRLDGSDHIILCEGPIDAIKCHLVGGNVATMGKAVSQRQIEIINGLPIPKVYIALDPDAQTEIDKLVGEFPDKEVYTMIAPPPYKDLGEMSFEEVLELYRTAPRVTRGQIRYHLI